jgi:hypothetical protein
MRRAQVIAPRKTKSIRESKNVSERVSALHDPQLAIALEAMGAARGS